MTVRMKDVAEDLKGTEGDTSTDKKGAHGESAGMSRDLPAADCIPPTPPSFLLSLLVMSVSVCVWAPGKSCRTRETIGQRRFD